MRTLRRKSRVEVFIRTELAGETLIFPAFSLCCYYKHIEKILQ
jgi:hypothetical protein